MVSLCWILLPVAIGCHLKVRFFAVHSTKPRETHQQFLRQCPPYSRTPPERTGFHQSYGQVCGLYHKISRTDIRLILCIGCSQTQLINFPLYPGSNSWHSNHCRCNILQWVYPYQSRNNSDHVALPCPEPPYHKKQVSYLS